jgi:hypothetical protein
MFQQRKHQDIYSQLLCLRNLEQVKVAGNILTVVTTPELWRNIKYLDINNTWNNDATGVRSSSRQCTNL